MAKPVVIGSRSFRTQSSALEHYKAVLHRYQDAQRFSDQDDHADLVALIERYDPVLDAVKGKPKGRSRDIPDGVVSAPADGQMTATFIDIAVADAFRTYHHDQAMLRILSRIANLQTASQARRPRVARPVRVPDR